MDSSTAKQQLIYNSSPRGSFWFNITWISIIYNFANSIWVVQLLTHYELPKSIKAGSYFSTTICTVELNAEKLGKIMSLMT